MKATTELDQQGEKLGAKTKKKPSANREEYTALFNSVLGDIRKDMFTETLLYPDAHTSRWMPVANRFAHLRDECRHLNHEADVKYDPAAIKDHFGYLTAQIPPQLIPDLPKWDNQDRIREMAEMLELNPAFGIAPDDMTAVLKEWMGNIFRKIEDPTMDKYADLDCRSFIFILQGPEKIGKDAWIRMLLCGLGQWLIDFTHGANERDTLMQIHRGAVLNVSEFDRLSKYESSFIKNIVTRPDSCMRASHAQEEETRDSRTSFIASVNPLDILRDSGENTRYAIFPLKRINFSLQKDVQYSLQCLAQARYLCESRFVAGKYWEPVRALIGEHTPEDPLNQIAEWWETELAKWLIPIPKNEYGEEDPNKEVKESILKRKYVLKDEVEELLNRAQNVWKLPRQTLYARLYAAGLRYVLPGGKARTIRLSRSIDPVSPAKTEKEIVTPLDPVTEKTVETTDPIIEMTKKVLGATVVTPQAVTCDTPVTPFSVIAKPIISDDCF
jgi:hypothetical protein